MLNPGRAAPEFAVIGGMAGEAETIGRTARVPISLTGSGRNEYSIRYRVAVPGSVVDRCPLLVPSAPADGVTRAVRIEVDLPADARRLPGEFPAFAWDEQHGAVTVGHMPSFVRVPYVPGGAPLTWRDTLDTRRVIDIAALVAIGMSTAAWVALRNRHT